MMFASRYRMVQYGVERALAIIGEAANRARKEDVGLAITNVRNIIEMRNFLVHAYDDVDTLMVWNVIVNHLPLLKEEVEALLQQLGDEPS